MHSPKGTAITTEGLTRRFGDLVAVDHLSVEIPAHAVIGFVGPNGSGKSTTLRMLLGLISPSAGTASVLAQPIDRPAAFSDRVGALIEGPAFVPNISGRANVRSMARLRGVANARVAEVLDIVGLSEHAGRKVSQYSLGMKQRLGIAIALLPDPQVLVLDEPTNGLDPAGIVEMRALIRQFAREGRTVVVASHLLSEIEAAADYLLVIRSGRLIYSGPLEGLIKEEQRYVDVEPSNPGDLSRLEVLLIEAGFDVTPENSGLRVLADPSQSGALNSMAIDAGVILSRLVPRSETLEEIFLRMTGEDFT